MAAFIPACSIPEEEFRTCLCNFFSERTARALIRHIQANNPESRLDLINSIQAYLNESDLCPLSQRELGAVLGVSYTTIWQLMNSKPKVENPLPSARKFSDTEEDEIVAHIKDSFKAHSPLTVADFFIWIEAQFKKTATKGYVSSFIARHSDTIRIAMCHPMESKRTLITKKMGQDYRAILAETVIGLPACMVFNLDETEVQEYVDSHPRHSLVPK